MGWQYQREESNFEQVPEGKHRIRVKSVEAQKSKAGNDMLVLQFDVSGIDVILYHYITFLSDKPEITNRMLTQFFDSFKDIPDGNFKFANWIGKVGACVVAKDKNDPNKTRLSYFIKADKQGDLPPWSEPQKKETATPTGQTISVNGVEFEEVVVSDSDLPF